MSARRSWIFRQWWRINKARGVISMAMWAFTVTGVWLPYLERWTGLGVRVLLPLSLIIGGVVILAVGYVWDRWRLWEAETEQNVYRSYAAWKPTPKERYIYVPLNIAAARCNIDLYRRLGVPEQDLRRYEEAVQRLIRWAKENGVDVNMGDACEP